MESLPKRHKKHPLKSYQLISSIQDVKKRNLLRGYFDKDHLSARDIESIRKGNNPHDCKVIGEILKGPQGLLAEPGKRKKKGDDLYRILSLSPLEWKQEVNYTAGYVNSTSEEAIDALADIKAASQIHKLDTEIALELVLQITQKHGASNYASYKLSYLRSARALSHTSLRLISEIENEIDHKGRSGFHFSALENLSPKQSIFSLAQRRVSLEAGRLKGNFRKAITLSNYIPTPLDEQDAAGFLMQASEQTLIDTAHAILVIFNLPNELGSIKREFEGCLNPHLVAAINNAIQTSASIDQDDFVTAHYNDQNNENNSSLDLYRISAAFLEHSKLASYRNSLDRVFGARMLSVAIGDTAPSYTPPFDDSGLLLSDNGALLSEFAPLKLDVFLRTYYFLRFIRHPTNLLALSAKEINYIFNNTLELESLLSEQEMRTLYNSASPQTKSLMSVLALALYRKRSINPDIDFEFRNDFVTHVKSSHNGSIVEFINHLLTDSPQIASYIVTSLDEVTLQKMYSLVGNATQASSIRSDILKAVGHRLNRIEFLVAADEIITRLKLSKLQKYFDESRMYVDSIAMKKWLDSNPSIPTQQYRSLYASLEHSVGENTISKQVAEEFEHLVAQIAKDAFEQFCKNNEFGIESYLGRRIRHNTLDGVTRETVDAVLQKPEYRSIVHLPSMSATLDSWLTEYKILIDKFRREYLQFKPKGINFDANLDLNDPVTKENIKQLAKLIDTGGTGELLNELVVAFCWKQITPSLEHTARYIKTSVLQRANALIEKHFSSYQSTLECQLKSELHDAINEVLRKVADWFQVPQKGFITASVRDICQIILLELHHHNRVDFQGNASDTKYTGISVHRLYDCLAVLLQNAHKHGKQNTDIVVTSNAIRTANDASYERVEFAISSTAREDSYDDSKQRITQAIEAEVVGTDMVTEGYTGIKKVRFITKSSEGEDTVSFQPHDSLRLLKIGFRLQMEIANETIEEKTDK